MNWELQFAREQVEKLSKKGLNDAGGGCEVVPEFSYVTMGGDLPHARLVREFVYVGGGQCIESFVDRGGWASHLGHDDADVGSGKRGGEIEAFDGASQTCYQRGAGWRIEVMCLRIKKKGNIKPKCGA